MSPISTQRLRKLARIAWIGADLVVAVALVATAALLWLEHGWAQPKFRNSAEAFRDGTIGTELLPLPVAEVLPTLAPQHFQPLRADGTKCQDWVSCFGFIPSTANNGLPVGFAVTNYRPQSAAPSPVPFVGFSCALCHTTTLRTATNAQPMLVPGPGSSSLNLFAWLDALQASLLQRDPPAKGEFDPAHPPPFSITMDKIEDAYRTKSGRSLSFAERTMISLWLGQFRDRLEGGLPRFDEPFGAGHSRLAENVPTGPSRTQPFRTLIRQVLERPGDDMAVYTKIATVFSEDLRQSAQFDGSISDLNARSSMAALAAGATVENMGHPEIAHNIRQASDFTRTLRPPTYKALFPEQSAKLDQARLDRGKAVYQEHCLACHGNREGAAWVKGRRTGEVIKLSEIKTDPERVTFRHYGELPERLFQLFPDKHPFHFKRDDMRPSEKDKDDLSIRGYVSAPLDGMFLRAPYLHNASVLTLAELINLKKRRDAFMRGDDLYDPVDVGFIPPTATAADQYFKFDTTITGNSNRGHDYPWAYDDPRRNVDDLAALLDYLKTL